MTQTKPVGLRLMRLAVLLIGMSVVAAACQNTAGGASSKKPRLSNGTPYHMLTKPTGH